MEHANRHQNQLISRLINKKHNSGSENGDHKITAAEFDELLSEYDAVTDITVAALAPELIAAYPDAKVILNRREDLDA